jgi:PKD repeat protein
MLPFGLRFLSHNSRVRPRRNRLRARNGFFEALAPRHLLTTEGDAFDLSEVIDATGLSGNLSATIAWGDGSTTAGAISTSGNGSLTVRIDYSLDSTKFFDTQLKKDLLASAVDAVVGLLGDDLAAIVPGGSNSWEAVFIDPGTGTTRRIPNLTIAADEIVLYVGGRGLGGGLVAAGGFGGFSAFGSSAFLSTVSTRGEGTVSGPAARDFAPWGGSLSFSSTTKWHFGATTAGLDKDEVDFISVAAHEFAHVLGMGTADSWAALIANGQFSGPRSVAEYDGIGNVPLSADFRHWADGVTDGGREAAMDPILTMGTRKPFTALDFAGLDDIGWDLLSPIATVAGSHRYADDGTYYGRVALSGDSGGVVTRSFQAGIDNAPPALTVAEDFTAIAGMPLTIRDVGTFTDPGFSNLSGNPPTVETFLYEIDWSDGSAASTGAATIDTSGGPGVLTQGSFDGSHTYATPGRYTVIVTVQDDDGGSDTQSVQVQVVVPPSLRISIASSAIAENAGQAATLATVSRIDADHAQPLVVTLISGDPGEAAVAPSVTIPAGQASATFAIDAVDDALLDGDQIVTLIVLASGFEDATATLTVADYETVAVTIDQTDIAEDDGPSAAVGTVTRSNTDVALPLTVSLVNSDDTEARVAAWVVIPAGHSSASFVIDAVDDDLLDGTQTVTIEASAAGYKPGNATLQVLDPNQSSWQNPSNAYDVDNNGRVEPQDVLVLINDINSNGARVLRERSPGDLPSLFLDVDGNGQLSAGDVLEVINFLNGLVVGAGEPPAGATGTAAAASLDPASRERPPRAVAFEDVAVAPHAQRSGVSDWAGDDDCLDAVAKNLSERRRQRVLTHTAPDAEPPVPILP